MRLAWLLMLSSLLVLSCATNQWHVQEAQGQAIALYDPHFVPDEAVEFRVGKASRMIEARHIEWLEIDPSRMNVEGGKVFYGAKLVLDDGSRFPDSSASDTLSGVFIGVDSRLVGIVGSSPVEIPLAQLRTLGSDIWFTAKEEKRVADSTAHADSLKVSANPAAADTGKAANKVTSKAGAVDPNAPTMKPVVNDTTKTATPAAAKP